MQLTVIILRAGFLMAWSRFEVISHTSPEELEANQSSTFNVEINLKMMDFTMGPNQNLRINIELFKKAEKHTENNMIPVKDGLTEVGASQKFRANRKRKRKNLKNFIDIPMSHYVDEPRYIYFPGDGDYKIHKIDINKRIVKLTASTRKVSYWLYTRRNPTSGQKLNISDPKSIAKLDLNKVTVFLVHGYHGHLHTRSNRLLTEAFLYNSDVNVIRVDWSYYASSFWYPTSSGYTPEIGRKFGKFINSLNITYGLSLDKVHLVGFSLGAHLVGNAGRELHGKVKRITGLDPAGPGWSGYPECLGKTDARYVEVIHTNGGYLSLGYWDPRGHSDHYPNGGAVQPNCSHKLLQRHICSHYRAYELMAASVKHDHLCANKCKNLKDALHDTCTGPRQQLGNADINKKQSGIFRTNTIGKYPF